MDMTADFLTLLAWFLTALDGILWVLGGLLLVEVVAALQPRKRSGPIAWVAPRPPLAVLIPARNEEADIGATVKSILPQLNPGDRLLVVADHCSDHTAAVAQDAGATVLEHNDPIRRGKGYALEVGLKALATTPPAIVIFIDADCEIEAGSLDALAHRV
ncbi:MAG: glycosyltransferase family 2 protein, partial [Thermosynechococcaceae cyanobacterium]